MSASTRAWNAWSAADISAAVCTALTPVSTNCAYMASSSCGLRSCGAPGSAGGRRAAGSVAAPRMKRYTFSPSGVKFVSRLPPRCPLRPTMPSATVPRPRARCRGPPLDPARARERPAPRAVAHYHRLGRRHRAARRRGDAGGLDRPAGAVRHQRATGADERVPARPRGLAQGEAGRAREPLSADAGRRAAVPAGVPAHLRAAGRGLGRVLGDRDRRRPQRRKAARAQAGAPMGGLRDARLGRVRAPRRPRLRPSRASPRRSMSSDDIAVVRASDDAEARRPDARLARPRRLGPDRPVGALPAIPAALRQGDRSLPDGGQGDARSRAGLHRAHAVDPRLSPRAAARSAAARHAAAARLARRRSLRAVPRLLSADASRGRAASHGHAQNAARPPAAGIRRVLRALRRLGRRASGLREGTPG